MRAEKRVVNAKKELAKLKEVAARLHSDGQRISKESLEEILDANVNETLMEVDSELRPRSAKSVIKINNQWMNQRKIKAIKSKIKRHNQKKARRASSAGLSSRRAKRGTKRK